MTATNSQLTASHSQRYFTTGGLPPVSSPLRQDFWLTAKLLPSLAGTEILGSESHGAHHLIYCMTALGAFIFLLTLSQALQVSWVKSVTLWPTVSWAGILGVKPHLRPETRFLFLSDSCGFVDVGRSPWREDESVTAVIISGTCHLYLQFYMSSFSIVTQSSIYRSVKLLLASPTQSFPGFSLLEIHDQDSKSKPMLLYDWRFVANHFVLAPSPLRITTRAFITESLRL
jgi:hypothetical protein